MHRTLTLLLAIAFTAQALPVRQLAEKGTAVITDQCPVQGCAADRHCSSATCVECTTNAHCANSLICEDNSCSDGSSAVPEITCFCDKAVAGQCASCGCEAPICDTAGCECQATLDADCQGCVIQNSMTLLENSAEYCSACIDVAGLAVEELALPNIDCVGTWSACTADCERGCERIFTMTTAASGVTGMPCPMFGPDCHIGDGQCTGVVEVSNTRKLGTRGGATQEPVELEINCDNVACLSMDACELPTHYVSAAGLWADPQTTCCPTCEPVGCYASAAHGGTGEIFHSIDEDGNEDWARWRCGISSAHAESQCGFACLNGLDSDCPDGNKCFRDLSSYACTGDADDQVAYSAISKRRLLDCTGGPKKIKNCPDQTHAKIEEAFLRIYENFDDVLSIDPSMVAFSASKRNRYKTKFCDLKVECIDDKTRCDGTLLGMSHGFLSNTLELCYDTIADYGGLCQLVSTIAHEAGHALSMNDKVFFHGNPGDRIYALGSSAWDVCTAYYGTSPSLDGTVTPTLNDGENCGTGAECHSGYCECECYTPYTASFGDECWGDLICPWDTACSGVNWWCGGSGVCQCNSDSDCASTKFCHKGFLGIGLNECRDKKNNGQTCWDDETCKSGRCFFGFCKACSKDKHCSTGTCIDDICQ